jgi:hypothetical protein
MIPYFAPTPPAAQEEEEDDEFFGDEDTHDHYQDQ